MSIFSLEKKTFLVIGDVMIDRYLSGIINRISPEAPVPVFQYQQCGNVLGGASNVAYNLAYNSQSVFIISVIGDDSNGKLLVKMAKEKGIHTDFILVDSTRKTTVKTRLIANNNQQVIRIDEEDTHYIDNKIVERIKAIIENNIESFDIVIISDYMKGLLSKELSQYIISICNKNTIPVIVDPKDKDMGKYAGCSLIKPNKKELQIMTGADIKCDTDIEKAALDLKKTLNVNALLVTKGKDGMTYVDADNNITNISTIAKEVYDVTGAGDVVLSYLALGMANGMCFFDTIKMANAAAGIKVAKLGTSVVSLGEINRKINDTKVVSSTEIQRICAETKKLGSKIIFTNGCFDIMHAGHITFLKSAKQLGDILVLGLNSDSSIKRLKGDKRPIMDEKSRAQLLEAIEYVDYIVMFDEDTPYELISIIKPDILVKGGDYTADAVVGKDIVEGSGGNVVILPFIDNHSTTGVINSILYSYNNSEGVK